MSKKRKVNWSDIDGASPKPKRLHLEKDETDSCITAQYRSVTMMGFKVKEVAENMLTPSTISSFMSTKSPQTRNLPQILQKYQRYRPRQAQDGDILHASTKHGARLIPSFSPSGQTGDEFTNWLTGSGGGYKKGRPAQQIINRCFKCLTFCCDSLIRKR